MVGNSIYVVDVYNSVVVDDVNDRMFDNINNILLTCDVNRIDKLKNKQ